MGGLSAAHWLVVVLVLVVVFGGSRLAEIGQGLGEGIRSFKKGLTDTDDDSSPVAELPAHEPKARAKRTPKKTVSSPSGEEDDAQA